jgi:hypothetical protein
MAVTDHRTGHPPLIDDGEMITNDPSHAKSIAPAVKDACLRYCDIAIRCGKVVGAVLDGVDGKLAPYNQAVA